MTEGQAVDSEELADLLDLFHDGDVVRIDGQVPGDITMRIQIEYLRHMYSEDGDCIDLTLRGCTHFSFREYGSESKSSSTEEFLRVIPEILSAKAEGAGVAVEYTEMSERGNMGTFWLECAGAELALDNGRATDSSELCRMSGDYWENWKKQLGFPAHKVDSRAALSRVFLGILGLLMLFLLCVVAGIGAYFVYQWFK